jgi:hypothetical protein
MLDRVDLSVKVLGGGVEVKRFYYDNGWLWEHTRNNQSFEKDSTGLTFFHCSCVA